MSIFHRLISPMRHAADIVFRQDVCLRREEGVLRIVLDEPKGSTRVRPPTREELKRRKDKQELALMQQQLASLLDELPETRQTLRHLVFVEQALAKKGQRALHKLPLDVLEKALPQLEGLVTNWSPVGLAALRSKMAVAIIDREHMDLDAEADGYHTSAVLDAVMHEASEPTPASLPQPEAAYSNSDDEEALVAAYAALGVMAPAEVQTQGELASPAARGMARQAARGGARENAIPGLEIRLLELHD
jgi:hypothetical protein